MAENRGWRLSEQKRRLLEAAELPCGGAGSDWSAGVHVRGAHGAICVWVMWELKVKGSQGTVREIHLPLVAGCRTGHKLLPQRMQNNLQIVAI